MDNRTNNAVRNIIWGFAEKILLIVLPFVTRTLMIKILGAQYLGLGSLFSSILTVLSITELGLGNAIVFSMYKPIAEGDKKTVCALLNTIRKIYRFVGLLVLTVGLILMPFIEHLIKGSPPDGINVYILYGVSLFNTVVSYFMYSYMVTLFTAHQRNDLVSKRAVVINVFSYALQIIALVVFRNYYVFACISPVITIATNLANAYMARKIYPEYVCEGTISPEMAAGIRKRVTGLLSFKIYGVVFSSVDTIVISAFLGLVILAKYNNYYYIQTSLVSFLTVITASVTAGIGNKMVTNSIDDNYRDIKNFTFLNDWLISWCSVCLICLYQPFITLWLGEDMLLPKDTMVLLVMLFLLPRISNLTYTYREAAGLWWEDRFRPIISAIVNLSVNLVLVQVIGLNGVIISTLACTVFINIPWGSAILFKHYFKRSPLEFFGRAGYYLVITCIASGVTYWICGCVGGQGLLSFLLKMVICVIVPNIIFLLFYHKMEEFGYARAFVSRIIGKATHIFNRAGM